MEEAALRNLIRASLSLAFVAAFSLANTTNAAEILNFSQQTPGNVTTSTNAGNNTTFSVTNPLATVQASKVAGVTAPPSTLFTETFNFTSSTAPVNLGGGNVSQGGFNGTFTYFDAQLNLTVAGNVQNATLSLVNNGSGGTTGNFNASQVTFTNITPSILTTAFGTAPPLSSLIGNLSLTLNDLNPINPTSLNFQGSATGIITAQITSVPEPASIVMASLALVAGLGGVGLRRIKASRA